MLSTCRRLYFYSFLCMHLVQFHMLNRIVVFGKDNDAFYFFFFQQHGDPCPVSFPHFIVRKGYRIEPLRFHFFCFLDSPLPCMEEIDKTDVVEFRRSGEVEVEEADEFQIFFPSDEARFFPEFPDGALQEIFASFDFTAEAIPLADAKAAFFTA